MTRDFTQRLAIWDSCAPVSARASCQIQSAAGFRLRYVTPDLVDIGTNNGADEMTTAIVNVNLRNMA